jgi:hypothetical protein
VKSKKPRPSAEPTVKDITLTHMRAFHSAVDWREWWEEFYLAIDASGRSKYRSIKQFITAKAANSIQRNFLLWYLGAKSQDDPRSAEYRFAGEPLDWDEKRRTGGWYTHENLQKFSKTIRTRINALDALREAGNGITLNSLARMEQLAQRIDEAFQGQLLLPGLSSADNYARMRTYIDLQGQVLRLIHKAQRIYAEAFGINFDDMSGFANLMAASVSAAQRTGTDVDGSVEHALKQIVTMTMIKSARFKTPLPPEIEDKVVEITAVEPRKKGQLQ